MTKSEEVYVRTRFEMVITEMAKNCKDLLSTSSGSSRTRKLMNPPRIKIYINFKNETQDGIKSILWSNLLPSNNIFAILLLNTLFRR